MKLFLENKQLVLQSAFCNFVQRAERFIHQQYLRL